MVGMMTLEVFLPPPAFPRPLTTNSTPWSFVLIIVNRMVRKLERNTERYAAG
jgi:hypothetical protein